MGSDRRTFLAAAVGATAASSGCIGFILGEEPLTFSASPAEVASGALSGSGFEHVGTDPLTWDFDFEGRTIEVENYLSQYRKSVAVPDVGTVEGAVFGALATPVVEVAGQSLNPIERVANSSAELAAEAQQLYTDFQVEEQLGETAQAVLDNRRTFVRLGILAALSGTEIPGLLHLARFQDAGDFLGLAGIHPRMLDTETQAIFGLASALEHGGE
jgi:hypothetical protein